MKTIRNVLKYAAGAVLDFMMPNLLNGQDKGRNSERNIRWKKAILYSRGIKAKRRGDTSSSEDALLKYWQENSSNDFYHLYTNRFNDWFLGPHQELIDQVVMLARQRAFEQMVELGCGDGRVLEHCAKRMPDIPKFTGIDINPMIIENNKIRYANNPALHFANANAWEWLPDHVGGSTLLLSYGGVMEYFSPQNLRLIFSDLAKKGNSAVALVEPVDPQHDLTLEQESHIFGQENSFSHNHKHLLESSGFNILFAKELFLGKVRWLMILAESAQ